MPAFRRAAGWDPVLILSQITFLQCFGYASFSIIMILASILTAQPLSPLLLFDPSSVRGDTVNGWTTALALLSMALVNIIPLLYIVERSRLCVDFTVTFYLIHLILVIWNTSQIPSVLLWWITMVLGALLMALGGRTVCLRRELLPIAIRQYVPADAQLRSEPGPGTEEYELESRVVANTEVMFETPADGHGGDNGHHRPDAAVATDDWGIDNWGEEDEEDEREQENSPPKTVPSRSATPATSAATAHASTPAGNSTNNSTNNSNSNSKGSKKD